MLRLLRHDFPRNVRELVKIVERARIEAGADGPLALSRSIEALLGEREAPSQRRPEQVRRKAVPEHEELMRLLDKHGGNVTHLAAELGVGRNTLYRWLKNAGVNVDDVRSR